MSQLLLERDVVLTLRDGIRTRCDVWRNPAANPGPAILIRTPYGKEVPFHLSPVDARMAADHGYALIVQDVRGRGQSEGRFDPYVQERDDGYDSVQWVAEQSWCDGAVMMTGCSYIGATQWLAATTSPPALVAIAPLNSSDAFGEGWSYRNGVREQAFLASWIAASLGPETRRLPDAIESAMQDPGLVAEVLPEAAHWFDISVDDQYWRDVSAAPQRDLVHVPAFIVGGWYDCFLQGTLASHARSMDPRDRLLIGPWGHDNWFSHLVGERNLGSDGSAEGIRLGEQILAYFDAVRHGTDVLLPPVQIFVLGARRWWDLPSWPPVEAVDVQQPLIGGGSFRVDPTDLPAGHGGRALLVGTPGSGWGPQDQRILAARDDVLQLVIEPVPLPTLLAGPAHAVLQVSADPGPRQWVALLCLEAPDGALDLLAEAVAVVDAGVATVELPLGDLCVELPRGSKLSLLVTGGLRRRWESPGTSGLQHILDGSTITLHVLPR